MVVKGISDKLSYEDLVKTCRIDGFDFLAVEPVETIFLLTSFAQWSLDQFGLFDVDS